MLLAAAARGERSALLLRGRSLLPALHSICRPLFFVAREVSAPRARVPPHPHAESRPPAGCCSHRFGLARGSSLARAAEPLRGFEFPLCFVLAPALLQQLREQVMSGPVVRIELDRPAKHAL